MPAARSPAALPQITSGCFLALAGWLLAPACSPERTDVPYTDEDPQPSENDEFVIGSRVDDAFVPYSDSGEATWVWGPQGGTMIQPVLSLDPAIAGDERQVEVTFLNRPDPDFDAPGELADFGEALFVAALFEEGERLVSDVLFNQIGWSDPTGVRMLFDVTVRGQEFAISDGLALHIVAAPDPFGCNDLPTYGEGCIYRLFEGTGTITSVATGTGAPSCDERLEVQFDFAPANPDWRNCYAGDANGFLTMEDGLNPPSACLEGLGIAVGSVVPVDYGETSVGMCMPWEWFMAEALAGCESICP